MTDAERLEAIRRATAARDNAGSTHWGGCEVEPHHRDCAIVFVLARHDELQREVERLRAAQAKCHAEHLCICEEGS